MSDLVALTSDLDHVGKFIDGFESIVNQFKEKNIISIDGCERYTIGVLSAEGIHFSNTMGGENFVVNAAKKLYEMISNMLKSIKDFFFGGPKVEITVKPAVSEATKSLQETNRKIDEFNKDTVMNLGPLSNDEIYKIIKAPENTIKEGEAKAKRLKLDNAANMKAYRIAKVSVGIARIVNGKEGLALKAKDVDIAKAVSSHLQFVKIPTNNLDAENGKINKSVTTAFNTAATSFSKKMEELEKYIDEHKDTIPASAIKSIPLGASKSIKHVENMDSALNMIKQLEVENAAAQLQGAIKELEKKQNELKGNQNPSEETLDTTKHLSRTVKLLSEALAPMDKFINYCFESSIKKDINYSASKLELIINCINADHKK